MGIFYGKNMKKTIITLLCLCLITGAAFYLLQKSEAQSRIYQPNSEKSSIEDAQPVSVPGKSAASPNIVAESSAFDAKAKRDNLPFSRFYRNIKPSPEKTIKLSALPESEKQTSNEKRLRIGTVRKFAKPVAEISDGSIFPVAEGSVWLVKIESEEALQLRLHLTNVNLPKGAKIFVYSSENPEDVFVYEKTPETENKDFWTPSLKGDAVVVEYFTPERYGASQEAVLPFEIAQVGHIYMNPTAIGENDFSPPEEPCHLNVPSNLSELAKSVGHLRFVDGDGVYVCTGTLLNNLSEDLDPLLLTANHCISTQASAQSLEAFWNYNSGDFPSAAAILSRESVLLSTASASDFTLLRVLGALPTRANQVFWSGWSTNDPPIGTNAFTIHHPTGSYKRYSSGSTINFCGSGLPCQNTIGIRYSQGTTEGGSSGGGLWNTNEGKLVGTLSGGESGCGIRDAFGKFSATYSSISSFMQGGGDDNFDAAGNDAAANAVTVATGTHNNLIVKWRDEDWYRISLPNGGTLSVTVNFTNSYGDIDLNLFRGGETNPVAVSASGSSSETINYTNSSGTTQNFFLRVFLFEGARNTYSVNISAPPAGPTETGKMFDYDGDGRADISVFRPSGGNWFVLQSSNNSFFGTSFGLGSDQIAPADFDGDRKTDVAVFRPSNGSWFLQQSANGFASVQFGQAGDVPVPADFDGDGRADITVFRPSNGTWYRLNSSNNSFFAAQFGTSGDKPQVADFDGDGRADLAVFRPSGGNWYVLRSSDGTFFGAVFGQNGDIPTTADFDGDRRADIAVFRPAGGFWYRLNSSNNQFFAQQFGVSEDKPVPADYDNDGRADIAVYRPSNGAWYLSLSTSGFTAVQFGGGNDVPTPSVFGQ